MSAFWEIFASQLHPDAEKKLLPLRALDGGEIGSDIPRVVPTLSFQDFGQQQDTWNNFEEFGDNFYKRYPMFQEVPEFGVCFAGSAVLHNLYDKPGWDSGDIDIFFFGQKDEAQFNAVFRETLESILKWYVSNKIRVQVKQSRAVMSIFAADGKKFQLIRKQYNTVADVLHSFDLGACQIAMLPDTTVQLTPLCRLALEEKLNVFDPTRMSTRFLERAEKYMRRGFDLALPFFEIPEDFSSGLLPLLYVGVDVASRDDLHLKVRKLEPTYAYTKLSDRPGSFAAIYNGEGCVLKRVTSLPMKDFYASDEAEDEASVAEWNIQQVCGSKKNPSVLAFRTLEPTCDAADVAVESFVTGLMRPAKFSAADIMPYYRGLVCDVERGFINTSLLESKRCAELEPVLTAALQLGNKTLALSIVDNICAQQIFRCEIRKVTARAEDLLVGGNTWVPKEKAKIQFFPVSVSFKEFYAGFI